MRCTLPTRESRNRDCTQRCGHAEAVQDIADVVQNSRGDLRHARIARGIAQLRLQARAGAPPAAPASVTSHDTPRMRTGSPRSSQKIRACASQVNDVAGGCHDAEAEGADILAFGHRFAHGVDKNGAVVRMRHRA